MISRWDRKVVQGATVAAAATAGAAISMAAIETHTVTDFLAYIGWALKSDIYTSVALPSFIAGLAFFPVGLKALRSRLGFALRAMGTTAAVCFVNRILVWSSYERPNNLLEGIKTIFDNPSLLWPRAIDAVALGLDWNVILGILATLFAGGMAWAVQPLMNRIVKQPRFEPVSSFEREPLRVPVRARTR
jgi:hypothetical protein